MILLLKSNQVARSLIVVIPSIKPIQHKIPVINLYTRFSWKAKLHILILFSRFFVIKPPIVSGLMICLIM